MFLKCIQNAKINYIRIYMILNTEIFLLDNLTKYYIICV